MRLFVSVDLEGLAAEIEAVQDLFADAEGISLTDPYQAHVTLTFLGDTDESRVPPVREAIEAAVEAADVQPFEAAFGGLGVFPHLEYISVVWLGVREGRGDAELTSLHRAIEDRTVALGFDPDDHEFTPHVTLGRMEHAGGKELVRDAVRERDPDVGTMTVSSVQLAQSHFTKGGPDYEAVATVPL